jgi:signal transduction histidine kinase
MLGIRSKLALGFGGLVAVTLAILLCAVAEFNRFTDQSARAVRDDLDSIIAARDMRDAIDEAADAAYESIRAEGPVDVRGIDEASKDFAEAMAVQRSRVTLPGEERLTATVEREWEQMRPLLAKLPSLPFAERAPFVRVGLRAHLRVVRATLRELAAINTSSIQANQQQLKEDMRSSRRLIYGMALAGVAFAAGFATVVGRRIVRPISALTASAERVARGDLDHPLEVRGRDELGRLGGAFEQMTAELRRFRAVDADKLSRAHQAAQTAIDSLPDGVIMLDERGRVELANRSAARLFAVSAGEEIATRPEAWLRESKGGEGASHGGNGGGAGGGRVNSFAPSIEVDDAGEVRHFLPRSVALRNPAGRAVGTTLILADVTDFRRLDQLKDSLLSMASHELKTPLTSMRVILPLVLERKVGPLTEKQAELLKVTADAVERMRRIVETILDLGRLASGRMPLHASPVAPTALVRRAVGAHEGAFAGKGVSLGGITPADLPEVRADAAQVDHVLANLLSNALRFTPAGGSVSISAARSADGAAVRFRVTDTGCGIAEVHVAHLFESFYRVPGQGADTGTGLGLALVRQVVEAHGGRVGVESTPGEGSTFWFTLPTAAAATTAAGTITAEANHHGA